MVQLDDDTTNPGPSQPSIGKGKALANCVRVFNVPVLNLGIILVLGAFLLKLTTKYKELYMKNSLITIIVTNLVLYGILETLAQTILGFDRAAPLISVQLSQGSEPISLAPDLGESLLGMDGSGVALPDSDSSDVDEEDLDRFLSFLHSSSTHLPLAAENVPVARSHPLTYFQFNRLAGFMCWGFIMAFVQCWWYRFLQIYSKHPQFVEVLQKVMSDQFCFSPISLFCFFTYGTLVLESGTWDNVVAKLRKLYLQTLIINYCVWFPVQFINFLAVPRDFQVPFSSSISVLWNCFLSMRNSTA